MTNTMKYGAELIATLEREIEAIKEQIRNRNERIANWQTDEDDCFISQRVDERGIRLAQNKIALLKDGGCAWFEEYATLDGTLVDARWCETRYGLKLRVEMPDGSVVWTTAGTAKGLAKKGLKRVECKRPAWFAFSSPYTGMMGVYAGDYCTFPSRTNYATGEPASDEPIEIRDAQ